MIHRFSLLCAHSIPFFPTPLVQFAFLKVSSEAAHPRLINLVCPSLCVTCMGSRNYRYRLGKIFYTEYAPRVAFGDGSGKLSSHGLHSSHIAITFLKNCNGLGSCPVTDIISNTILQLFSLSDTIAGEHVQTEVRLADGRA